MIVIQARELSTCNPPADGIQADREHDAGVDRIAALASWFVGQAEDQEHDYSDDCGCVECRAAWDEFYAEDHEYEPMTRGV